MLELFMQPETWVIFATLFALEVVLGVDNVVFISVLCERLPAHQRKLARNLGITLAVAARIVLVFSISWVMSLTHPVLEIMSTSFTGRDIIMIAGGAFLLLKSAKELWSWLVHSEATHSTHVRTGLAVVLLQIVAVDAVFSMDSVITAVGLTSEVPIMVAAILSSAVIMVLTAEKINHLVSRYPGFKTLALLFLVLLGGLLMAEGFAIHVNKGYVYFAMAFGLVLELCHIRLKKKQSVRIKRIRPFKLKAETVRS
ncbi:TerC family protein [Vibrio sp. Isolate25]|uniref:TerC family protein n=1 Tax=Vibrio TaxID=662 RepID=UPI001EFD076D|nr:MULTISPECIES: TerC family protein [Vibrio]MCG9595942.1 TerC family protein [Vibrio sp. Isolate25]MCG9677434.1 TerC family protein [Vibrio sp. Isolate24]USD35158.1 TerC family protein [Vibrio sp. SCSIO 43186]USD48223.1 TerC family protein [Vibrio sp. SCSIO 43145]USD72283.1 TerC family protein [Vibrio sp. SCSIO 43139]